MAEPVVGENSKLLGETAYCRPFRRYQQLALEAFEQARSSSRNRLHIALPPGAGKTVLGLEIARRMGRYTLVLCPNTAIQAQWASQWQGFTPPTVQPSLDDEALAPLTILTYQSLCNLDDDNSDLRDKAIELWQNSLARSEGLTIEQASDEIRRLQEVGSPHFRTELANFQRRARALIAQGGDRQELLALLHRNGQQLIASMKPLGPWTLILDECHHLLDLWGYLVRALVEELGEETFLVGLTGTPPQELDTREDALYRDLFHRTDFQIPTPAAVKEGNLAPYQDLVYLTLPPQHEMDYIADQHARFLWLISRLMDPGFATLPFVEWVHRRVVIRKTKEGAQVRWSRFERDRPSLALAALRFLQHNRLELPQGVPLQERHRRPPTADDWVELLEDYCLRYLKRSSDPKDIEAWQEIRRSLPSLGYVLSGRGVRRYVSPVDRVLALSAGKAAAALAILGEEERILGSQLRAVLLCDYERAGSALLARLRGVLDPQAGSAALLLRILLSDPQTAQLDPILMTGQTVACSRATVAELVPWIEKQVPQIRGLLRAEPLTSVSNGDRDTGWDDLLVIRAESSWWRSRNYVPLLTRYFEDGRCRCLVGTRGLLGEGWDAKKVNVLIDLTTATTSTAVHQIRGRSLRLDPANPRKVANNWDIVCVAPDHPKGLADYQRFVRKHQHYYALTPDGEIECGVSHVHSQLSPYGPPAAQQFSAINQALLKQAGERDAAYQQWGVGTPYLNLETQTLRVKVGAPRQTDYQARLRRVERDYPLPEAYRKKRNPLVVVWALATLISTPILLVAEQPLLAALVIGVYGFGRIGRSVMLAAPYRSRLSVSVGQLATTVAEALQLAGALSGGLGPGAVRVVPQKDGYYRCYLEGASADESKLFVECLDELMAPLGNPRYIMPRFLSGNATPLFSTIKLALHHLHSGWGNLTVVYHAVPSYFVQNRQRIKAFQAAWNRHVSPGQPLSCRTNRGKAILEVVRGESPFDVYTQMRALWR